MSKHLLRAWLAALLFIALGANARAVDCDSPITAEETLKAEDGRYVIQANQNYDAMQRLFGDDLVYVHSTGVADDKAGFIERQRAGLHYLRTTRDEANVRVFGCLAIIAGAATLDITQKDVPRNLRLRFLSIWAKRGSDLKFISWESTLIPPKP